MKHKTRTLLIDGDILAYQAAAGVEKVICWDTDVCLPVAHLTDARVVFEDRLTALLKELKTTSYIIALSDAENFRRKLLPTYKSNRSDKPKPVALKFLKEAILADHPTYLRPGLEADDILGILSTAKRQVPADEKIIVSLDKDLRSIPGLFFHLDERELETITEEQANRWHMTQTLTGDQTDGYAGCPGIGPKKAAAILDGLTTYDEMWPAVVAAYTKAGFGEDEALTQARVARILRAADYDFKNKEIKLWDPRSAPRVVTRA